MMLCKVSVRVGLGNEPCDLQMPFLSVNPPRVACLDPVRVLMNHVMPSLHHQLARQESPSSLASPPASSPLSSIALLVPPCLCPQDATFKSLLASPRVFCRRHASSMVCATSARSSNICQTVTLCMTSSMHRSSVLTKDCHRWKDPYWNWLYLACIIYLFICFLCFNFVLDSRCSLLVVPYRLRHRTPSTTTHFNFVPTVAPLTCHLFTIII